MDIATKLTYTLDVSFTCYGQSQSLNNSERQP
jgi:hypothetical protein